MEAVRERTAYDRWLLWLTLSLMIAGAVAVLIASQARAQQAAFTGHDEFYFFKRQAVYALLAAGALYAGLAVPYWRWKRFWAAGLGLAIALLVLVLFVGREANGAKRWLGVGPLSFQPSEFAKLALVLFLAQYSNLWRGRIAHFWKGFLPPVLATGLVGVLVAKEDLGTAVVILVTGTLMIYMAGARTRHLIGLAVLGAVGAVGLVAVEPYRIQRIVAWLNLMARPMVVHDGAAYQPAQGLIALGSGGVWGRGLMHGIAKHLYLPAEHTDYIFATLGEEVGLVGCLALLLAMAMLIVRGLTIAHRTRDWFGSLVAAGITTMIGVQALLNIAVVTGLVPCTGVPLPFISYGGTSLLFTGAAMGIVLNISQHPGGPAQPVRVRKVRESTADGWRHRRAHLSRT